MSNKKKPEENKEVKDHKELWSSEGIMNLILKISYDKGLSDDFKKTAVNTILDTAIERKIDVSNIYNIIRKNYDE